MNHDGFPKATSYANEAGLRIYGYYQAIPSVQTQGPGPVGEKILAKLRQTTPDAFGLLVRFGAGVVFHNSSYSLDRFGWPIFQGTFGYSRAFSE
jgi:hypothetical protein